MSNPTNDNAIGLLVSIRGREESVAQLTKQLQETSAKLDDETRALAADRLAIAQELGIVKRPPSPPVSMQDEIIALMSDGQARSLKDMASALGKTYNQISSNLHWIMKRPDSPIARVTAGVYVSAGQQLAAAE